MPIGYTKSDNYVGGVLAGGGPVALNAVAEIVAQDASSVMLAGTVLGRINLSTGVAAAISQANPVHTGTGVITMDATAPCQLGCRQGVYTVNFTGAAAGYVTDPAGVQIGAAFTSLPNPWTQQIKFVVTGVPVNGDVSTITIPAIVQTNGTHTGSGVITMDGTTPVLYRAKPGLYAIYFTGAAAGFVLDPNGAQVGGPFTALPNPFLNELKFVVTGTPAAADVSYIFVMAGTGKLKRFVSTNFDGSQNPEYIIINPNGIDATGGDVTVGVPGNPGGGGTTLLKVGTVNANALILQNEPLQSYIPLLGVKVIDALTAAGFNVRAGNNSNTYEP
jgi:hypothetical protein